MTDEDLVQVVVGNLLGSDPFVRTASNIEQKLVSIAQFDQEASRRLLWTCTWHSGSEGSDPNLVGLEILGAREVDVPISKCLGWRNLGRPTGRLLGGCRLDDEKRGSARSQTTAAVIASMYICKEQIILLGETVPGWVDSSIEAYLKTFDKRYYVSRLDLRREPEEGERDTTLRGFLDPLGGGRVPAIYFTNYLWMVEQLATLSERKRFRGESWHAAGKETLLAVQQESGAFDDWTMVEPRQVLATCFALHFLKRTTPPPKKPAR